MSKKRIGIVNSIYPYGSTGRICFEMQKYLNENGFDSLCFHGEGIKTGPQNYNFSSKLSKYTNAFLSRLDDRAGFHSKIETKRFLEKLDEFSPDLLIVHNMHAYYLNIDMFLTYVAEKDIPVIFVLHDCWNFTGHCAHFDYARCSKWKEHCHDCPQTSAYPKSLLFDNSFNNFDDKKRLFANIRKKVFVSPSFWLSNLARGSFLKNDSITTINNGIDLNIFKKQSFVKKAERKMILCVANVWSNRKGIDDAIKLSSMLPTCEIVVVGKLKRKLHFPSNVKYIEQTTNLQELVKLYSSADAFFNPTYEDTYSMVNVEALACGCPVICYKTGGATEMIKDKYAVKQGDLESAADSIKRIVEGLEPYDFPDRNLFDKKRQYESYLNLVIGLLTN